MPDTIHHTSGEPTGSRDPKIGPDYSFYADSINASVHGDVVWDIMNDICLDLGFASACCRCFPSEIASNPTIFFSRTRDFSDELEQAIQSPPGYLDPFLQAAVRTSKPFRWSDLASMLGSKQSHLSHFAKNIEPLGAGIVVPVFGPLFRNGYFCFHDTSGAAAEQTDLSGLHAISQTAYLKLCDLMYKEIEEERHLSERELEIINLIARGQSSQDVSTALEVSINTVNTHVKRIFEKLDVSDRVSAVMRAYALGYVA